MKRYKKRLVDELVLPKLYLGGLLIEGVKDCGKTMTAQRIASSAINLLENKVEIEFLLDTKPENLLDGPYPQLIDEWQAYPLIFNLIKTRIDEDQDRKYILAGSANPPNKALLQIHSGAGRFAVLQMKTMSWLEKGYSNGSISLNMIQQNRQKFDGMSKLTLEELITRIAIGGWPRTIHESDKKSITFVKDYLKLTNDSVLSTDGSSHLNPVRLEALFKSISRNIATPVKYSTLANDIDSQIQDYETVRSYVEALEKAFLVEKLPSWNVHLRSSASLRKTPKIHFCDPSIAISALLKDPMSLMKDGNFFGLLFESLVYHELSIYAYFNNAKLFYYQDSEANEIDYIVDFGNRTWLPIEVKLNPYATDKKSGKNVIDLASKNLHRIISKIDTAKMGEPLDPLIITAWGPAATRKDGVRIVPLDMLGV
ncbi:MAG: DUF4143 domain-containing protein [Bifidobacteriaceae bacterium]|jgi:predicted AAA+ superfamily ATPase|nr:DUF4143 domain-containing protein [Bifidobacteriaceae bacterium]